MGRAPCCEKVGLKRGRWTAEEDQILINYIEANGEGSWRTLPKIAGLLRCGKSCRLRWINYLRSDLKRGNISTEEEELIIKLHASLGNRWSLIAGHLPGRTDNEIKNYWNSHLSKRLDSFRVMPENQSDPPSPASAAVDSAQARSGGNKRRSTTSPPNPKKNKRARAADPSQGPEPAKQTGGDDNVTVSMPCTPTSEKESLSSAMFWEGDDHHRLREEEDNLVEDFMGPVAEEAATASLSNPKIQYCDDVLRMSEIALSESAKASETDDVRCQDNNTTEVYPELNATIIRLPCGEHGRYNSSNVSASASSDDSWGESGMEVSAVVGNGGDEKKLDDWNSWDDWKWEDEVVNDLTTVCGEKAGILSWLWDSGYSPGDGDFGGGNLGAAELAIDDEKPNDIVAWLFS